MKYLFMILPAVFWSFYDLVFRFLSDKISSKLAILFTGMGTMLVALFIFFFGDINWKEFTPSNGKILIGLLLAGIFSGLGNYYFFKFFENGGNLTQGVPIIAILNLLLCVLMGVVIFQDTFNWRVVLGIILGLGAIYLLESAG